MILQDFTSIVDRTIDQIRGLLVSKRVDYASDADVLHNFKESSDANGLTKFQIWGVYFTKHVSSILGAIRQSPNRPETMTEPLEQRIDDSIAYLILLKGLLEEGRTNKTLFNYTYTGGLGADETCGR